MPSLNISLPGVPTLLTGLSPVAANPIAAIDGTAAPAFASVIDGLGHGFTLDASPPLGTNLPPQRPDIAGDPVPLPDIDIEAVMVGATGTVPTAPDAAVIPVVPSAGDGEGQKTSGASPEPDPSIPVDTPIVDPGPVACGLEIWRKGMPRGPHGKIAGPAPIQLPPQEIPDMPAADPAAPPVQADKPASADPVPAQAADAPAPPPAPAFAPLVWTPPPPQPADPASETESEAGTPHASVPPSVGPAVVTIPQALPDTPKLGDETAPAAPQTPQPATPQLQPQVQPQPQAAAPASLPNSFTLPPDVARDIAQLVKAAVGERDDRASSDGHDSAQLPASAAPAHQIASSQPAPLHPSFAPVHRPIVDTGRAEWMQAMIDRIAEMPQAEGGNRDAQIRLVPDALGPVDVKIEQRQDRLHVTLNAETPQARLLLSDAAPKLHELAEARGIRFAQTGFGSADSHDRRHAPDQQPAPPSQPRPAAPGSATPDSQPDGDLIA
jgi:hypothetical protein